jgi:hypothetical protein
MVFYFSRSFWCKIEVLILRLLFFIGCLRLRQLVAQLLIVLAEFIAKGFKPFFKIRSPRACFLDDFVHDVGNKFFNISNNFFLFTGINFFAFHLGTKVLPFVAKLQQFFLYNQLRGYIPHPGFRNDKKLIDRKQDTGQCQPYITGIAVPELGSCIPSRRYHHAQQRRNHSEKR